MHVVMSLWFSNVVYITFENNVSLLSTTLTVSTLFRGIIRHKNTAADRLLGLLVRIPPGAWVFVLCVLSNDKIANCRTVSRKKQVRMKYKQSAREYKKRIPVGARFFRARPDRLWGPPSLLHNGYRVFVPGVKRPGCGVNHPPHLAPRLKKEYSYYSAPPVGLHGRFWGELHLHFFTLHLTHCQYSTESRFRSYLVWKSCHRGCSVAIHFKVFLSSAQTWGWLNCVELRTARVSKALCQIITKLRDHGHEMCNMKWQGGFCKRFWQWLLRYTIIVLGINYYQMYRLFDVRYMTFRQLKSLPSSDGCNDRFLLVIFSF